MGTKHTDRYHDDKIRGYMMSIDWKQKDFKPQVLGIDRRTGDKPAGTDADARRNHSAGNGGDWCVCKRSRLYTGRSQH